MKRLWIFLLFCRFCAVDLFGQSWPLELFPGKPDWTTSVIESYDNGFIFGSVNYITNSYLPIQGKLFKTDVNGTLLWQKYIDDHYSHITLTDVVENDEGEIFLAGISQYRDPEGDAFIMKMDPCLNVLWCKILRTNNSPDYIVQIRNTSDGGCIALLPIFDDFIHFREWLFRYDAAGNLLWKSYHYPDSLMMTDNCLALIPTPDSCFLMYGFSYVRDSINGVFAHLRTLYMKVDEDGNLKWYRNFDHENDLTFDCGNLGKYNCTVDSLGNIYSNLNWWPGPQTATILFLAKFSGSGEPIYKYPYTDTAFFTNYTDPNGILLLDDNLFAMSYGGSRKESLRKSSILNNEPPLLQHFPKEYNTRKSTDELQGYNFIQLIDSLGDTITKKPFVLCNTLSLLKTHDSKIVLACTDTSFLTRLYKFNYQLDFDSIYTVHGPYNYKCTGELNLDTYTLDGEIYTVGVSDSYSAEASLLSVFPNPTCDELHVRLPDFYKTVTKQDKIEYVKMVSLNGRNCTLEIVDLFGRSLSSIPVGVNEKECMVNTSLLLPGMYMLLLKNADNVVDKAKFMKQ